MQGLFLTMDEQESPFCLSKRALAPYFPAQWFHHALTCSQFTVPIRRLWQKAIRIG